MELENLLRNEWEKASEISIYFKRKLFLTIPAAYLFEHTQILLALNIYRQDICDTRFENKWPKLGYM